MKTSKKRFLRCSAELAELEKDRARLDWLAEQHRLERKAMSDASVKTGEKPWPMDEVTILVQTDDGHCTPVDGPTFRAAIDAAMQDESSETK